MKDLGPVKDAQALRPMVVNDRVVRLNIRLCSSNAARSHDEERMTTNLNIKKMSVSGPIHLGTFTLAHSIWSKSILKIILNLVIIIPPQKNESEIFINILLLNTKYLVNNSIQIYSATFTGITLFICIPLLFLLSCRI